MKWLFGFAIAITLLTPTDFAFGQQTVKERDEQGSGQQADRGSEERAQGKRGGGRGRQGGGGLFRLLDADRDGKLSAKEIDGAIAVLMKLDRNRDSVLDSEELASAGRGRGGGQRGKGGGDRDKQSRKTQAGNAQ
jgi:hypothetical protein